MTKIVGGWTETGKMLNDHGSTIDQVKGSRVSFKYGIISQVYEQDGVAIYRYKVKFQDEYGRHIDSPAYNIGIADTIESLAQKSGGPKSLLNKFCMVAVIGPSSSRGFILAIMDEQDLEIVEKSNQVQQRGSAFASPVPA